MNRARKAGLVRAFSLTGCSAATAVFAGVLSIGCVTGDELDPALVDAANDQYFRGQSGVPSAPASSSGMSPSMLPNGAIPNGAIPNGAAPLVDRHEAQAPMEEESIPPDALTLEQWLAGEVMPATER